MTTTVDAWEPGKHVRWLDESGFMGAGHRDRDGLPPRDRRRQDRVRLVQSGFGASEGWDDFFEGTEAGWTYFLYNLRLYLERHLGKVRHLISERIECPGRARRRVAHLLLGDGGPRDRRRRRGQGGRLGAGEAAAARARCAPWSRS